MKLTDKEVLQKAIEIAIEKYDVDEFGNVLNKKRGNIIKPSVNRKGYEYFSVYIGNYKSKKIYVHKFVAIKHIPNPKNLPVLNHIDGNPLNNHKDNLEWCTVQHNVQDGFNRGRIQWNKGESFIDNKICPQCEKEFKPKRTRVTFCSVSCSAINREFKKKEQ